MKKKNQSNNQCTYDKEAKDIDEVASVKVKSEHDVAVDCISKVYMTARKRGCVSVDYMRVEIIPLFKRNGNITSVLCL